MNNINYKTYAQLATDIRRVAHRIPEDVDLVVGIPRSGMIPAYMIGAFLNLPVMTLDEFLNDVEPSCGDRPIRISQETKRVLIVDDSVNRGVSLKRIKERLEIFRNRDYRYVFFAAYATSESSGLVDIHATIVNQPRVFQWNYLNHGTLERACLDIDGVLCVDPTEEENDDGERYLDFLRNAKPLYIPKFPIKALVTSRLEKYRESTEEWLARQGVRYERLYMLDLPDKETRLRNAVHGKFKSEIYSSLDDCVLFIESRRSQAIEIAVRTGKLVICSETDEIFPEQGDKCRAVNDIRVRLAAEQLSEIENEIGCIKESKSFRLGSLFFRSVKSPLKAITFPANVVRIFFSRKKSRDFLDC